MNKQEKKEKILNHLVEIQTKSIESLKKEMQEAQKSANEYGCPKDRYDAYRAQMLRKRDMFGQQLQKAAELRDVIRKIPVDKIYESAEFGAVVITDRNKIIVAIGLGKVKIDDDEYFSVSPAVPVFKAMEGKKVGDSFSFNGNTMKILDIY
jgi:transcription elongation GreA/GreB family factor